jgi:TonB-linked SusC/RagA family outer membrane protein
MKRKLLGLIVLCILTMSSVFAQNKTITGKVLEAENGLPLPGVSVRIKGTTNAVQTDDKGIYNITVPNEQTTLVYSFLSFVEQEKVVGKQSVINISLLADSKTLNEVVFVAYGTAKKEAVTGSIATIGSAEIEKRTVTNATQLLGGAAPGIATTSGNGQPGSGVSIRLRGTGSFAASSSPLIILDGSQYDGSIGDINVNDIDNLSILKDASSSALYGARAANGVIMITTKRGKGAGTITASVNQGYSERGTPEYDRVDAFEYYPAMWQAVKHNFMFGSNQTEAVAAQNATNQIKGLLVYNPFNVADNAIVGTDGKINPNASLLYDDFDWFGPATRTGKRTDANVGISGRNEKTDYYVSLGYLQDQGFVIKSDMKRFSGRVNVNSQVKPWLKFGVNLSASISNLNNAQDGGSSFINPFVFARGIGPIYPITARDANGATITNGATGMPWYDYGQHPGAINRPTGASPGRHVIYETMLNDNLAKRNNIGGRTYVDVKFLKDFTFTPSINVDLRSNISNGFQNPTVGDGNTVNGRGSYSTNNTVSYTFNQMLSYKKTFGDHEVTVLAGHENYDYAYRTFATSKTNMILTGNIELDNFVTPVSASGNSDKERIESYFSKATYSFADKYFLDASIRQDGSSRFHPDNRWGTFFSVGAGWSIIKENFMKNVSWVNDLRLKASYGEVGNNALASLYSYQAFYDLGWNSGVEPGILLSTMATPDLKWETNKTFNTGLVFSLFGRRLNGELEYFKRGSGELIFSVPNPLSDPVTSTLANIGSMENRGWELSLGGDVLKTKNFSWNLMTNWTVMKNEITKMPAEIPVLTSGNKRREVGQDYYQFWLRQYAGVDATDGSSLYIPAEGTLPANIRNVNGTDYVIDPNFAKFAYSGSATPDLMGSFINTFTYKSLSLSVMAVYGIGGKFYDSVYAGLMSPAYGSSLHKDVLNSWTPSNTSSDIPRLDMGRTTFINGASSRWLVDGSYLNLRNVNLSYALPKSILGKIDVSNARIFATGENLFTLSKRRGLDPAQSFDGSNGAAYLPSRIFSFGINLSL